MTTSVEIIIQSHLSDSMIEINFNPNLAKRRISFVKYLMCKYRKDERIDASVVYKEFLLK